MAKPFVAVTVTEDEAPCTSARASESSSGVSVVVDGRYVIRLSRSFDPVALASVIKILGGN